MSENWGKKEIVQTLQAIATRLNDNPANLEISYRDDREQRKLRVRTGHKDGGYTTELNISGNRRITLNIGQYHGDAKLSIWPWKDKAAKAVVKSLWNLKSTIITNERMKVFYKAIPEAMTDEFEKEVLDKPKS
jgi:hypothetical protein